MKTTSTRPVLVFFLALLGLTSCVSDSVWLPKSTGVRLSSTVQLTSPSPPGFSLAHFPDAKLTPSSCASCPDASENLHRLGALERGALNLSESRVYSQATVRTSNKRTESTSREDHQDDTLPISMTSLTSGVVWSSESSCPRLGYYCPMDASFTVTVPENHATMISFPTFVMQWAYYTFRYGFAELSAIRADGSTSRIWRARSQVSVQFKCLDLSALRADDSMSRIWRATSQVTILPEVFHTSVRLRVFVPSNSKLTKGFSMRFSIHSDRETPPTVRRGVFNCSVPFFPAFKQHLACNLKAECEGGEDENSDCPFTDRAACPGGVVVEVTWEVARRDCQKRGGDLATLTSSLQWQAFFRLASSKNLIRQMYIGLKSYRTALPRIYNYLYVWVDGIVNYRIATRVDDYTRFFNTICFMHKGSPRYEYLYYIACDEYLYQDYVCQITVHNITGNTSILLPPLFPGSNDGVNTSAMFVNNGNGSSSPLDEDNLMYVRCEDGHVTHNFLSCDTRSQCGEKSYPSQCSIESNGSDTNSVEMFPCDDQTMTIHYTLVCDFRQDCHDGSDESLCVHRQDCQAFQCHSGQCIYPGMKCNGVTDCWDGSDEECIRYLQRETSTYLLEPPAEVSFDTDQQSVTIRGQSDVVCPMTHYLCPDGFCFPLYTRCNGVADCAGREDEAGCQEVQCPGLYRCLSSAVCLHADHLCDGWPQCPQRDDEWLCQHDCPKECQCQGHAFVCSSRFPAASFPHLRYLDAADSGMKTRDVTGLSYLVWLSLRQCGLTGVTEMSLPNVRTLDLSHNDLDFLAMDVFLPLINLRVLDLSHNPLSVLVSHGSVLRQLSLGHVDLSHVLLGSFNSSVLSGFPTVTTLNLSESDVTAITADGFQYTPSLRVLDLRGSDVREYPRDVFLNHTHLRAIYADNYKLCCKDLLPEGFDQSNCHAPVDEISSCDDLLRSNSYRAFLWIFSVLSILGNLGSLVSR
ncbi:uncharacterized protein [Littorina saxatilis]|uniref:uncharacterized protein n=1 Tax=Littorina saxatilis TaxID=31220 RepID=UPI0038B4A615